MDADAAIVAMATWTTGLAAGYLIVGVLAAALRNRPRIGRAVLGVAVATAVTGGGVALAQPDDGGSPHPPAISVSWPIRPTHPRSVVVTPGDSLWTIAARRLERPTAVRVAAAWPHWWRTNRRVVGPDPNLIRPGQRLLAPTSVRSRS
jgi:nucleoid-associated protein YgaU